MCNRKKTKHARWIAVVGAVMLYVQVIAVQPASAVAIFLQVKTTTANSTIADVTYSPSPAANHLLVVICSTRTTLIGTTTFTPPTGFTLARNNSGSTVFQSIFYKIADGTETTVRCQASRSGRMLAQAYEYSGNIAAASTVLQATGTNTGTSTTVSTGSVTTTTPNTLLVGGIVKNSGGAAASWSNGFTERVDLLATGRYFGVDLFPNATGTYSSTATSTTTANWLGQIAAFNLLPIQLTTDIVDTNGASVTSPAVTMSSKTFDFVCQTSTGSFGTSTQKVRVSNTTASPAWTLSIAPTNGPADTWSDGTQKYDMNDPTSGGCGDGADADAFAGQLTINPSVATIAPGTGCTNTGVTLGASGALNQGVVDSVTIMQGSSSATLNCYWDVTGVALSQTIPAEQAVSADYKLSLMLTIVPN